MKRIIAFLLAIGALAVVTATAASAREPRSLHVIKLKELLQDRTFGAVDNPPLGQTSVGDSIAFSRIVARRSGERVGRIDVTCVATAVPTPATAQQVCHGVLTLAGGQLALETAITGAPTRADVAVTGGTGTYADAGGVMRSVVQASGVELITLTLLR